MVKTNVTACLVVIFNHFYPGNIDKLLKYHVGRFSRAVFLVPNERTGLASCYTVYRGSYCFHGYIADALGFLEAQAADYYIFMGDDVLLHPRWTESEYFDNLGLREHQGFFPELHHFAGNMIQRWEWSKRVIPRLFAPRNLMLGSGVENALQQMPDPQTARAKFAALGFHNTELEWVDDSGKAVRATPPISIAWGVSDFFAIRSEVLRSFAHYCGVLASLDIFVEAAIPTALIYACDSVCQCRPPWRYDWNCSPWRKPLIPVVWSQVLAKFDDRLLFVHPVKFSTIPIEAI